MTRTATPATRSESLSACSCTMAATCRSDARSRDHHSQQQQQDHPCRIKNANRDGTDVETGGPKRRRCFLVGESGIDGQNHHPSSVANPFIQQTERRGRDETRRRPTPANPPNGATSQEVGVRASEKHVRVRFSGVEPFGRRCLNPGEGRER